MYLCLKKRLLNIIEKPSIQYFDIIFENFVGSLNLYAHHITPDFLTTFSDLCPFSELIPLLKISLLICLLLTTKVSPCPDCWRIQWNMMYAAYTHSITTTIANVNPTKQIRLRRPSKNRVTYSHILIVDDLTSPIDWMKSSLKSSQSLVQTCFSPCFKQTRTVCSV